MNILPEARVETAAAIEGEGLQESLCIVALIRKAQEQGRPLEEGAGEVVSEAHADFPDLVLRLRKCAGCTVQCGLVEYPDTAPRYLAKKGESAHLPQCQVLE